jgi:predicted SprT family Zn-dependent metalloprotease
MQSKKLLNKITHSIIEQTINKELIHQMYSNVITSIKKVEEQEADLMQKITGENKQKIRITKVSKAMSAHNNYITNTYENKIIGPISLSSYDTKQTLGLDLNKKLDKEKYI